MKKILIKGSQVKIPSNVEIHLDGSLIKAKGPKGSFEKNLFSPGIKFERKDDTLFILPMAKKITKSHKTIINTISSHTKNMIIGVLHGFEANLKICSGHFPMSVSIDNKMLIIKNFFGEKVPRKAQLPDSVSAKIDGDIIRVSGCDKNLVGQTAAIIERTCRIRNRDRRRFQDGIWLMEKAHEVKNG